MKKLEKIRKDSGKKLREIAERLEITPQTVQQMEKYGIRKRVTAERYARALNCDWRDLLD